jgi:hypothetical protein
MGEFLVTVAVTSRLNGTAAVVWNMVSISHRQQTASVVPEMTVPDGVPTQQSLFSLRQRDAEPHSYRRRGASG